MTVEATPLVVEKLSASVSGVHGRVCARSAQPVQRSSTVSPFMRTVSAPPPRPRVTSFPNASAAGPNAGVTVPRTSGGRGSCVVVATVPNDRSADVAGEQVVPGLPADDEPCPTVAGED